MNPHKLWNEQCDAAESIAEEFGNANALGYIIGEKFLKFIQMSDVNPDFRSELTAFAERIRDGFEQFELAEYLETLRLTSVPAYTGDDLTLDEMDDGFLKDDIVHAGEKIVLIERAADLLMGD